MPNTAVPFVFDTASTRRIGLPMTWKSFVLSSGARMVSDAAASTNSPYGPERFEPACVMTPFFTVSSERSTFHFAAAASLRSSRVAAPASRSGSQLVAVLLLPPVN